MPQSNDRSDQVYARSSCCTRESSSLLKLWYTQCAKYVREYFNDYRRLYKVTQVISMFTNRTEEWVFWDNQRSAANIVFAQVCDEDKCR